MNNMRVCLHPEIQAKRIEVINPIVDPGNYDDIIMYHSGKHGLQAVRNNLMSLISVDKGPQDVSVVHPSSSGTYVVSTDIEEEELSSFNDNEVLQRLQEASPELDMDLCIFMISKAKAIIDNGVQESNKTETWWVASKSEPTTPHVVKVKPNGWIMLMQDAKCTQVGVYAHIPSPLH